MSELKDVLLVGSVPGESVEGVMRSCTGGAGDLLSMLPDGELGNRSTWVLFLATTLYDQHADIETLMRPRSAPGKPDWVPAGYDDFWHFRLKPETGALRFEQLGYAAVASESYETFRKLRDEGAIGSDTRFQVCLPATESSFRWFWSEAADFEPLCSAYREAMAREIETLCSIVPAGDLCIQWDVCMEILAVEAGDHMGQLPMAFDPPGEPFDRYVDDITVLAAMVPESVTMGIHLCYGDLGHKHLIEPTDLGTSVRMANASVANIARRVDFFHVPVPRDRNDDDYFAPLADLDVGAAKFYVGLVHHTDGAEGTLARLETAKRHLSGFGIATECGFGRRSLEQVGDLLEIHRAAAAAL